MRPPLVEAKELIAELYLTELGDESWFLLRAILERLVTAIASLEQGRNMDVRS